MKSKVKHFFLIITGIIMVWSCQQDDDSYNENLNTDSKIKVSKITFKEIFDNPKHYEVRKSASMFKDKNFQQNPNAKPVYNEQYGFYIDEENGKYIEKDNLHSYTFSIERPDSDDKIENIIFNYRPDGTYDIIIAEYNITNEELEYLTASEVSQIEVQYSSFDYQIATDTGSFGCISIWHVLMVPPEQGEVTGGSIDYVPIWVLQSMECGWSGGTNSGATNPGSGEEGGGYFFGWGLIGNTPGSGNTYSDEPNFTDVLGNPIITTPVPLNAVRNFVYGLTTEQKAWWNDAQNENEISEIEQYLFQNGFNQQSEEFAQWAIDFLNENTDLSFDDLLNNRTGFDTETGDFDNNTVGGYDNTTYEMVNPNNLQQDWPTIETVIPVSEFVGWNRRVYPDWHCMDYAKAQIAKKGYSISDYNAPGQTFQIYKENTGVDVDALWEGVSYLKYALSNGIPVIVGIDNKTGSPNPYTDNTTDHFVVIVGTGLNQYGEIYFRFFDNAAGSTSQGASTGNMLFLDSILNMLVGQTEAADYRNRETEYSYIVTQIRKSK